MKFFNELSSIFSDRSERMLLLLLFISVFSLSTTANLDVIDIDSAQYAEISREMAGTGDYFRLLDNGKNYLDKPILTFWKIVSSFKLFGISNFSFRFPALLFTLLSVYSIFRLTYLIYGDRFRALIAAIAYSSAPGLFSMVLDPKIDIYLVPYLIFVHHAYYLGVRKNKNFYYLMYIFMGLGFITKGPISIVIPAISIGGDILFRRDWKRLGEMKLFSGVILALIFPVAWGYLLFREFSFYGPHFFFWIQSFGRFYRQSYNQGFNPLYFPANFSWAFFVFIIPLFYFVITFVRKYFVQNGGTGSFRKLIDSIKTNGYQKDDFVISFWLFLTLFLISFSKYQLPQYIYWMLPAGAVFASGFILDSVKAVTGKFQNGIYLFSGFFFWIMVLCLPFCNVELNLVCYILLVLLFIALSVFYFRSPVAIIGFPVLSTSLFYLLVNLYAYPELLKYQPSAKLSEIIRKIEPDKKEIFIFRLSSSKRSYSFYSGRFTKPIYDKIKFKSVLEKDKERLLLVPEEYLLDLKKFLYGEESAGKTEFPEIVSVYDSYKVATPEIGFFLPGKRDRFLKKILLVRIKIETVKI